MQQTVSFFTIALTLGACLMTTQLAAQMSLSTSEFVTTQPSNQSLARVFLGAVVKTTEGDTVGDVNDLMFDSTGKISTVVIGVGGFLGLGEKVVAVPFNAITVATGTDGARSIVIKVSKDALKVAPAFAATEKTTLDVMRDKAADLGHKTADKANELKDQAARKIEEMTKGQPPKK
jgi:sporulation protein YlmC with PRC-barrel domain